MPSASNKPRISFNAVFELTETYFQLARELSDSAESFFICPDHMTRGRLLSYGVAPSRILDLSITRAGMLKLPPLDAREAERAAETEKFGPGFPSLVMMSGRFYRQKDSAQLYNYLARCALKIEDFMRSNGIEWAFAEPTTAPEILSYSVAAKLGVKAVNISVIRHPASRCAIFTGIDESAPVPLAPLEGDLSREELRSWLEAFRRRGEKTITYDSQSRHRSPLSLMRSALSRTGLIFRELSGKNQLNYTNFPVQSEIFSRRYRSFRRRFDNTFIGDSFSGDPRPYVVFFLHVQPERTIDVMSPHNSNQLEVIRQLRMVLPSSIKLAVKEHPSAYGIQPPAFYRGLEGIPDVSLLKAGDNTRKLLESAAFAATITGTVGMEAALLDIPAVVLSDVFFSRMPNVFRLKNPSDLSAALPSVLKHRKGVSDERLVDYLYFLVNHSHPCDWDTLGGWKNESTIAQLGRLVKRALQGEGR